MGVVAIVATNSSNTEPQHCPALDCSLLLQNLNHFPQGPAAAWGWGPPMPQLYAGRRTESQPGWPASERRVSGPLQAQQSSGKNPGPLAPPRRPGLPLAQAPPPPPCSRQVSISRAPRSAQNQGPAQGSPPPRDRHHTSWELSPSLWRGARPPPLAGAVFESPTPQTSQIGE